MRLCRHRRKSVRSVLPVSSPRVRGSPLYLLVVVCLTGSIPAGAGKPSAHRRARGPAGVHPRGCGEAEHAIRRLREHAGPSPRVRGSRAPTGPASRRPGSIPAGAGKPCDKGGFCLVVGVHPRGCGEARPALLLPPDPWGPSPRVRGSLEIGSPRSAMSGSIPAGAGKPRRRSNRVPPTGVHPRGCGEAHRARCAGCQSRGPSPRVRGSLEQGLAEMAAVGSIPALAGLGPSDRIRSAAYGSISERSEVEHRMIWLAVAAFIVPRTLQATPESNHLSRLPPLDPCSAVGQA